MYCKNPSVRSGSLRAALGKGERWENAISFTPTRPGNSQSVEFLLFRGQETEPYRTLSLLVNVTQ